MTAYQELRQRHFTEAMAALPGHMARLDWSAEQIRAERDIRLRALVDRARDASPWHRARLSEVDLDYLTTERLPELPPMTKTDLLTHFDDIVTDTSARLRMVEDHLDRLTSDACLLDEHHAIASGGSSGHSRLVGVEPDLLQPAGPRSSGSRSRCRSTR